MIGRLMRCKSRLEGFFAIEVELVDSKIQIENKFHQIVYRIFNV